MSQNEQQRKKEHKIETLPSKNDQRHWIEGEIKTENDRPVQAKRTGSGAQKT